MKKMSVLPGILWMVLISCSSPDVRDDLDDVVATLNEKCPKMIDSETRIEQIDLKGDTLVYNYSLVNFAAEKIDTSQFYQALWPGIISNIKVSPEMKKLREAKIWFHYVYLDKQAKHIYTFRISPADYN
jgi:hypothetical protein